MMQSTPGTPAPVTRLRRDSAGKRQLEQCRSRLLFIALCLVICYSLLAVRLLDISLFKSDEQQEREALLAENGITSASSGMPVVDERGRILDRNGEMLAVSLPSQTLFAKPRVVNRFGREETAAALAKIFPDTPKDVFLKKLDPSRKFSYLRRMVTPAQEAAVLALGVPGLEFESAMRRIYPQGNLFSHIVGFTDVDGHGISGIEKQFDAKIGGKGEDITLSVDSRLQHIMRDELATGIKEFQAIGGVGMIMDIHSGELLSMVSMPDFDPNDPRGASPDALFNRCVAGVYEMGSTFKTFTTAMALHHKTSRLFDRYDATHPIKVARFTIRDSHPENRWLTVPEIFMLSSNIGTVRMILEVGRERQQEFLKRLGMFDRVKLELPETAAPLIPKQWRDINMMTISYGHGMSVTPMHVMQSIGSLLGDGKMLQPTLLLAKDAKAQAGTNGEPIIETETISQMRKLMRLVVEHGTAKKADAAGYRVGGKTGTAEKVKAGGYSGNDKMASFVGVFPTDAPRYVIMAMLDEPRGNASTYGFATGGWVSAPIVKKVVEKMAPLYGIRPIIEEAEGMRPEEKLLSPEAEDETPHTAPAEEATAKVHNISF